MPERNDMIEQELRGLEAIVADPRLPPRVKMEAIRGYERTLSERVGITLRAMQGVG
ncbi:MAG: hypothetical protein NTW59_02410 [Candidatus Diapherotrites archaeon]|nr:hypothetical protein [Candidatus Diapherotrites archaeon]